MTESRIEADEGVRAGASAHRRPGSTAAHPPAFVSVDLDSGATHLAGYGRRPEGSDRLLEVAVPRVLDLLAEVGVPATLFVVAGDAPPAAVLRGAVRTHEIAAHSTTHPMPFARLPRRQLDDEVRSAKTRLEEAVGAPVVGFRAPNWDTGPRLWEALAAAGYRYDASLLPTPWQLPIRLLLALGARSPRPLTSMWPVPAAWHRMPRRHATPSGSLWQLPVSTTPASRLPVYHTARYRLDAARVERMIAGFADRGEPFGYAFHAVDAVALSDPDIPRALARHPGMDLPLDRKLALLRRSLRLIADRFRPVTGRDLVGELESGVVRDVAGA